MGERSEPSGGLGRGKGRPSDMPLMSAFHDTRFWYHALIGQMASCWLVRGAVDSIAFFQCHAPTIRKKILLKQGFRASKQISLGDFSLIARRQEEQKMCLWSVAERKTKHSKYHITHSVISYGHISKAIDHKRLNGIISLPPKAW